VALTFVRTNVVGLEPSLFPHGLVAVAAIAIGPFPVRRVELAAFSLECKVHVPDQLARPDVIIQNSA
jgi:hypothetical protein